jgi:predicted RNase H-like HicB family nuclease
MAGEMTAEQQSSAGSMPVVIVQAQPQFYSQADLERDEQIRELGNQVTKLSEQVNRLGNMINDMGEKMDPCSSMNEEPFNEFTVVLHPDDNGTFVAYVLAIPGCHAWGRTPGEAKTELVNVFKMVKEMYEEEGKSLPKDIDLKAIHACQS